ncbi:MAG TPA: hypothetical protein VK841_20325 [Polyangiaceae bacterium]|nr:hypothetical protein [Polyangiaceae bacterium]
MTAHLVCFVPLSIQAVAMGFDELHFHRRRGLGRWERLGHPLDTLTLLACLVWILAVPASKRSALVYAALATLSCLFITKDEFVHTKTCGPAEHWLHALLFVVHPVVLLTYAWLWPSLHGASPSPWDAWAAAPSPSFAGNVVWTAFAASAGFCVYQLTYWNGPWTPRARPTT